MILPVSDEERSIRELWHEIRDEKAERIIITRDLMSMNRNDSESRRNGVSPALPRRRSTLVMAPARSFPARRWWAGRCCSTGRPQPEAAASDDSKSCRGARYWYYGSLRVPVVRVSTAAAAAGGPGPGFSHVPACQWSESTMVHWHTRLSGPPSPAVAAVFLLDAASHGPAGRWRPGAASESRVGR